jgi:ribosomal protein S18 acetylase RimI-like enzyme
MVRYPDAVDDGKPDAATRLSRRADFAIREQDGVCYLTPRNPGEGWTRAAAKGLRFRAISDDDLPFLARVYAASGTDSFAVAPWPEAEKAGFVHMQFNLQHMHFQKQYPQADWLVIMREAEELGRLYIERRAREHRIIDLALLPEHRGKGIGEALLRDVMDEAAGRRKAVSIHVEKTSPAMRLLRRLGFTVRDDNGVYDLLRWSR